MSEFVQAPQEDVRPDIEGYDPGPVYDDIIDTVEKFTSPEDPWTSRRRVVQEVSKTTTMNHDREDAKLASRVAERRGDLFGWHGLLTIPTDDRLIAIIEDERENGKRKLLIGKVNRWRSNPNADDDSGGDGDE